PSRRPSWRRSRSARGAPSSPTSRMQRPTRSWRRVCRRASRRPTTGWSSRWARSRFVARRIARDAERTRSDAATVPEPGRAAELREGFTGPLFIQGDHVQVNAKKYAVDPETELQAIRTLIDEELHAGFYNIDVDTSTLVDLSQATLDAQQRVNYERAADLTKFIRDREPEGVTVSVGAEIGEVGGKNSDVHELKAFMDGYVRALPRLEGGPYTGISKISVQTGTSHGGVV